jgi:PilZ domain
MPSLSERRRKQRHDRAIPIEVRFDGLALIGATANVNMDGVYFVAPGPLTVEVRVRDGAKERTVRGRVVRIESRDASSAELGVAVRFDLGGR